MQFKNILGISGVTAMLFTLVVSCNKIQDVSPQTKKELITKTENDGGIGVTVSATFHRGNKWSKAHGVTTCTAGFGICKVSVGVSLPTIQVRNPVVQASTGIGTTRIQFLEAVDAGKGDIFISSEDDDVILPPEVAEAWGYTYARILADDYVYHEATEGYPHGYVDVTVKCE